jgi:hypothetical protein
MPRNANIIGRNAAKFRHQAGWTQEFLAARMQLPGCYISRDIIWNRTKRCLPEDCQLCQAGKIGKFMSRVLITDSCIGWETTGADAAAGSESW